MFFVDMNMNLKRTGSLSADTGGLQPYVPKRARVTAPAPPPPTLAPATVAPKPLVVVAGPAAAGTRRLDWREHVQAVNAVRWAPPCGGPLLATAGMDASVRLWSPAAPTHSVRCWSTAHTGAVRDVRWRADGARLATASFDHTACLLDPETGAADVVLRHDQWVTALRFHPQHPQLLLTGGGSAGVFAWDARAPATYASGT
jgi:WD40 repeat protein